MKNRKFKTLQRTIFCAADVYLSVDAAVEADASE